MTLILATSFFFFCLRRSTEWQHTVYILNYSNRQKQYIRITLQCKQYFKECIPQTVGKDQRVFQSGIKLEKKNTLMQISLRISVSSAETAQSMPSWRQHWQWRIANSLSNTQWNQYLGCNDSLCIDESRSFLYMTYRIVIEVCIVCVVIQDWKPSIAHCSSPSGFWMKNKGVL